MKKVKILLSLALAIAFVSSCSNDEQEIPVSSHSEYFTESDIEEIKSFNAFMETCKEDMRPTMQQAIKRNRAKTRGMDELTAEEEAKLRAKLAEAGSRTLVLCENLGIDMTDLNALCSFEDNKELYGIIGVQISDALDPTNVLPMGPDGCLAAVDWGKAAGCLTKVLGIDDAWDLARAFTAGYLTGYTAKEALKKAIKDAIMSFLKRSGALAAAGGVVAIGLYVLEWGICYYD